MAAGDSHVSPRFTSSARSQHSRSRGGGRTLPPMAESSPSSVTAHMGNRKYSAYRRSLTHPPIVVPSLKDDDDDCPSTGCCPAACSTSKPWEHRRTALMRSIRDPKSPRKPVKRISKKSRQSIPSTSSLTDPPTPSSRWQSEPVPATPPSPDPAAPKAVNRWESSPRKQPERPSQNSPPIRKPLRSVSGEAKGPPEGAAAAAATKSPRLPRRKESASSTVPSKIKKSWRKQSQSLPSVDHDLDK